MEDYLKMVRAACASTLNGVFFLLHSLTEGIIVGFRNFAWGFSSQKKRWGEIGDFLGFFLLL